MDPEIEKTALKAKLFGLKYYRLFDLENPEEREKALLPLYVEPGSVLVWNGHSSASSSSCHDFLKMVLAVMPSSEHRIKTMDVHPLPGCVEADLVLLNTTGRVGYNREIYRTFFHSLIVRQHENNYYIMEDDFRWIGERSG